MAVQVTVTDLAGNSTRVRPEQITLDKLISWTEHADKGVKYFSGTATYERTFDLPADRLGARPQVLRCLRSQRLA